MSKKQSTFARYNLYTQKQSDVVLNVKVYVPDVFSLSDKLFRVRRGAEHTRNAALKKYKREFQEFLFFTVETLYINYFL